jgi:hypothetical protein
MFAKTTMTTTMMMTTTRMMDSPRVASRATSGRRSAVVVRAAAGAKTGPYEARNEFVIRDTADAGVRARFEEEMAKREALAKTLGCESCGLKKISANEYAFEQRWGSKEAYEAYMNHPERRRSHLTVGVWQRLPKDKWSVPDNFTPVTNA